MGSKDFRGFLGVGLSPDAAGDWARTPDDKVAEAFGFYLYDLQPLTVRFQARTQSDASKHVKISLNSRGISSLKFDAQLKEQVLNLPIKDLKVGMNWISIQNAKNVEWLEFQVRPEKAGRSIVSSATLLPGLSLDGDDVILPFGQSLTYAIDGSESLQLQLQVEPALDSGAPSLEPENVEIDVTVVLESPVQHFDFKLTGLGAKTLRLPPTPGDYNLQLRSKYTNPQGPLPGQVGVTLTTAKVEQVMAQLPLEPSRAFGAEQVVTASPSPDPDTNIIIVLVDTLRADYLTPYGGPETNSPSLSEFAHEAVLFENSFAEAPWTKPSVASLMTSLQPREHGVIDFLDKLEPNFVTLAEILSEKGYETSAFVTNPLVGKPFGFDQGFKKFVLENSLDAHNLTNQVSSYLHDRTATQPLFLYLHYIDPHLPYSPPREKSPSRVPTNQLTNFDQDGFAKLTTALFLNKVSGQPSRLSTDTTKLVHSLYNDEIRFVDKEIGRLFHTLRQKGLYDNSIIVVTSDHGEELLERGELGHMHSMYQELLHIPLLIKFPQNRHAGTKIKEVAGLIDVGPTILDAAGLPRNFTTQGLAFPTDLQLAKERLGISEVNAGRHAQKAKQSQVDYWEKGTAIRDQRWKFIRMDTSSRPNIVRGLFNLEDDTKEKKDALSQYPVTAMRLESELNRRLLEQKSHLSTATKATPNAYATEALRSLQYLR